MKEDEEEEAADMVEVREEAMVVGRVGSLFFFLAQALA